jgi:hypothetical protein
MQLKPQNYYTALRMIQFFKTTEVQKHRTMKVLARPVLSYDSEACTVSRQGEQRFILAKMKFLRKTAG